MHPATQSARSTIYGYPRQGPHRELKKAVERHWRGRSGTDELLTEVTRIRTDRLRQLNDAGLDEVPVGDFSLYDHVLDTAWMVGAIPPRHQSLDGLDQYFAMARGTAVAPPLEMTKWFDTNYHYLVPELGPDSTFALHPDKLLAEIAEARDLGLSPRAVVVGPVTFLSLAKDQDGTGFDPLSLLDSLVKVYAALLGALADAGVDWVQLDEPILVQDQPAAVLAAVDRVYRRLAGVTDRPKILLASYFDQLGEAAPLLAGLPVEGLAVDFTGPAAANLDLIERIGGLPDKRLVAGVVDGRNVWRADLTATLDLLDRLRPLADQLDLSASCSLLHVPIDVELETELDPQVASWFAFADQKVSELVTLTAGFNRGRGAIAGALTENLALLATRRDAPQVLNPAVRDRVAAITDADTNRHAPYSVRAQVQRNWLQLPALPTTTIGSFPQTTALRQARADLRAGRIDQAGYDQAMRAEVAEVIELQTSLGLDVLVHGEPERNDMVQYFAEQLAGYASTQHGWVQSYGSRYVRPPILFGDVSRPQPMTVEWADYAQGLTERPVKGMLTGPVTMLTWSFVRDDLPLADTAAQVALALRDEVADLERAGIGVIQVDEPALRETLPLRSDARPGYLDCAVRAFKISTGGVADRTQVHTHMCYAEFGDIMPAIVAMDADVISLEAARSRMEVVDELVAASYPREVGPGVWDIHSPRVPSVEEMAAALRLAVGPLEPGRLWVNPDCGLKTRGYTEVTAALTAMVAAARRVRAEVTSADG